MATGWYGGAGIMISFVWKRLQLLFDAVRVHEAMAQEHIVQRFCQFPRLCISRNRYCNGWAPVSMNGRRKSAPKV